MADITQEWITFQQQCELLRQKIADAELLVRVIAASATVDDTPVGTPPSEPPNAGWDAFPVSEFVLEPGLRSLRSVWQEWKHGVGRQPPVQYMEQHYGSLEWVRGAEQRQLALTRAKIVQEIELHLEHGRELEEIFVVGALHLRQLNNSMALFAATIQHNMEQQRTTLFADSEL